jgi:hypothetical protein
MVTGGAIITAKTFSTVARLHMRPARPGAGGRRKAGTGWSKKAQYLGVGHFG